MEAAAYATVLALKKTMEHSGGEDEGENLFMSDGNAIMPDAVRAWLREESVYHYEQIGDGDFQGYGHYSTSFICGHKVRCRANQLPAQCMWHGTTRVGIGMARSSDGLTFIVARYTPEGNMSGEHPY